jgi:hypothetical protein
MDQDLKEDLISDLVKFKQANRDKGYKTKSDLSAAFLPVAGPTPFCFLGRGEAAGAFLPGMG